MKNKNKAEEVKLLKQMREWSISESLGLSSEFKDTLRDTVQDLIGCLEVVDIDAMSVDIVSQWTCIICGTANELKTFYGNVDWNDDCKECGCYYELAIPDF